MKSDARVRYTKAIIRECFLKLLKKKPVDRITVKELCDMAQINRATFYSHYNDCFDLLKHIEDEFLEQFVNTGKAENWCNSRELISAIYDTIEDNMDICDALIFDVQNPALLTRMLSAARSYCICRWRQNMPSLTDEEQDMLFTHLSTGLSSVMYSNFKTCGKDKLISFMLEITNNCLEPYRN